VTKRFVAFTEDGACLNKFQKIHIIQVIDSKRVYDADHHLLDLDHARWRT
jgi:hypothetical protein